MLLSQLYQPPRAAFSQNTYHRLLPSCEYCKVFKNGLFDRTPPEPVACRYSSKYVFLKVLQTSQESTCVGISFKNLAGWKLATSSKRLQYGCLPVKFAKFLRTQFLTEHLRWLLLHLQWLLLYFFKKVLFNESYLTAISQLVRRTNNFFFSTHCLMYKKSNSFVYKFVVNCQVF